MRCIPLTGRVQVYTLIQRDDRDLVVLEIPHTSSISVKGLIIDQPAQRDVHNHEPSMSFLQFHPWFQSKISSVVTEAGSPYHGKDF